MIAFEVKLGAVIDSVRPVALQTRKKTGIPPQVLPSFGSVE